MWVKKYAWNKRFKERSKQTNKITMIRIIHSNYSSESDESKTLSSHRKHTESFNHHHKKMYNTANPEIDAKIEIRRLAKPDEI